MIWGAPNFSSKNELMKLNISQGVGAGAGAQSRNPGAVHFCRSCSRYWRSHLNSGGAVCGAGPTLL